MQCYFCPSTCFVNQVPDSVLGAEKTQSLPQSAYNAKLDRSQPRIVINVTWEVGGIESRSLKIQKMVL